MNVEIPADSVTLRGILAIPQGSRGFVVFAHGTGSGRLSPRNQFVAEELQRAGIGTLLFDLLTEEEDQNYEMRFNIELLTKRLEAVTRWVKDSNELRGLRLGYFGASTGAAAALKAAAHFGADIVAVVSRGGRPDLAMDALDAVTAPTLLIVGGLDTGVIELNERALAKLKTAKELAIVPGATHLFEEQGTLEEVACLARDWFKKYL